MFQSVRGSKHWFLRKSEVLCRVREYGSPTLFLTLSCAKYNSPEISTYLGKVNTPVTHYFVKKEYQACGAPHYDLLLWIDDVPVPGRDDDDGVILQWIQERITCCIPEEESNPDLDQMINYQIPVAQVQQLLPTQNKSRGYFHYSLQVRIPMADM